MDPKKQQKIARKGGKTISQDKEHMSMIGRVGGIASGKARKKKMRVKKVTPKARVRKKSTPHRSPKKTERVESISRS
jgi:hypothetical protein